MYKMRTVLFTTALFVTFLSWAQKAPEKVKGGYKVEIKTSAICDMCKEAIEEDLTFEKGVKSIDLNVDTKIATVVYNSKKTDPNVIRKRITKVGYNADDLKRDPEAYEKLPLCCKDGAHGDMGHMNHKKDHK